MFGASSWFVSFLVFVSLSVSAADFAEKKFLNDTMSLKWKIEGANIHFRVEGKTKGWIGIGFNDVKKMTNADFVVGLVDKKGVGKVVDHYGTGPSKHDEKGGTSDLISSKAWQEGDKTIMEFVRPLAAKNPKSKSLFKDQDNSIMLSFADGERLSKKHEIKNIAFFKLNFKTGNVTMLK